MSQSGPASSSGSSGSAVDTLTGNSGGAVSPTAGNINVIGSGSISVAGNPGTSTLTISASGGSSALTLIATKTATTVTSLTFTSGLTYNNYLLVGTNVNDALTVTTPFLLLQISTNGGVSYISTNYASTEAGLVVASFGSNTASACFGCSIYNFTSANGYITVKSDGTSWDPTGSSLSVIGDYDAYTIASTTANAFKLVMSDASAFSGVFSLYGYTT